ncbi:MAG: Iron-sulfur cluster carrier protein [Candidatus Methanophagaceae archaeon]|nr:MAG: Iron-sulfur cluster carrier protein [Methanophagales archaeon]KAF5433861.1 ATP-binding protein involved in chromosome partitioning [Methanophagales archaeon]
MEKNKSKLHEDMSLFQKLPIDAKKILAIASGKGGVGKSTVTVNLALALVQKGYKVGLLDSDIYAPNIPLMLGIENEKVRTEGENLIPIEVFGMKVMSVGFITDRDRALIWRGALANKLIEQFFRNVEWGKLDILIIDLPPGTGDVPLSIMQKVDLSGGIIVTTPQEASIADVRKMINMFKADKIETEIIGIVENMKYLICSNCNTKTEMFPRNNSKTVSEELGYKLLAEFPFETQIGVKKDNKTPYYLSEKESLTKTEINKLAAETEKALGLTKK